MQVKAIGYAVLAALLYGLSAPLSKVLLGYLTPTQMAAALYLGAGVGMGASVLFQRGRKNPSKEASLSRGDLPYVVGMVLLDIAAPIFLMIGLTLTASSTASLLNNFEIVATSLIALVIFKEAVGRRMWWAIGFITVSSILLSIGDITAFQMDVGAVFVLMASLCWGLENNCTRMLSLKSPLEIVVIKGLGSGQGALGIALLWDWGPFEVQWFLWAMVLGFFAFGMSIYFYILAQRHLGASRTSAFYAAAPFIGVLASFLVLKEPINSTFMLAAGVMLLGTYLAVTERHDHKHRHVSMTHAHSHRHDDGHHTHAHDDGFKGEHTHEHKHEGMTHRHKHFPDLHHTHEH